MTATPAPALTAAEQRTVDRFDAAPYPVEVAEAAALETVARAIHATWCRAGVCAGDIVQADRTMAAAAIAAYRAAQDGGAEEAARRVRDGIDSLLRNRDHIRPVDLWWSLGELRAALATQAGDER